VSADRELLDARLTVRGRWFHLAAYWGSAPGTHRGAWRTDTGRLKGWNLRVGRLARCFTVFVHTRRV
jgi:hypothetical protein